MSGVSRTDRVASLLEGELGRILLQVLPQHSLEMAVTKVTVSPDLKGAKVWLDLKSEHAEKLLGKVKKIKGRIRGELAKKLVMRSCPDLRFVRDENPEYVKRMDELFEQISGK